MVKTKNVSVGDLVQVTEIKVWPDPNYKELYQEFIDKLVAHKTFKVERVYTDSRDEYQWVSLDTGADDYMDENGEYPYEGWDEFRVDEIEVVFTI